MSHHPIRACILRQCRLNLCTRMRCNRAMQTHDPEQVLAFWFPEGIDRDMETHKSHLQWQMRGGADAAIVERFAATTAAAARGELDGWTETARGRLALVVVLDQFSRSVFRDTPKAYAQDGKTAALVQAGLDNGHYAELQTPWERTFYGIGLAHAEGPDALQRMDRAIELADEVAAQAPAHLRPLYEFSAQQPREHRKVLEQFGRHPHRNAVLGRESTRAEQAYLKDGAFPHQREIETP
jgi:uncharacterized protein (DUF924 family)